MQMKLFCYSLNDHDEIETNINSWLKKKEVLGIDIKYIKQVVDKSEYITITIWYDYIPEAELEKDMVKNREKIVNNLIRIED